MSIGDLCNMLRRSPILKRPFHFLLFCPAVYHEINTCGGFKTGFHSFRNNEADFDRCGAICYKFVAIFHLLKKESA
jgi:hypothetical protein